MHPEAAARYPTAEALSEAITQAVRAATTSAPAAGDRTTARRDTPGAKRSSRDLPTQGRSRTRRLGPGLS